MSRLLKSTATVASGEAVAYGVSFLRGVLLARLLSVENFGVAAFLLLLGTFFDLSSRTGFPQLVIRSDNSDRRDFIATLNVFQFGFACLAALLSILFIYLYGSINWSMDPKVGIFPLFFLVSLPLLKGLENLDFRRFPRKRRFFPIVLLEFLSQLASLACVYPSILIFGDYRAAIACIIVKYAVTTLGTHLLAEESYRWGFKWNYFTEVYSFCWPMFTNSLIMILVTQGDQLLVAKLFSSEVLGQFAAAASLVLVPANLLISSISSSFLPHLRQESTDQGRLLSSYLSVNSLFLVLTIGYLSVQILVIAPLTPILYGPAFSGASVFVVFLSMMTSIRMLRVPPAILSLTFGDSKNQLITNLIRFAFFGPTVLLVSRFNYALLIPLMAVLAEVVCFSSAVARASLSLKHRLPGSALSVVAVMLVGVTSAGLLHSSIFFDGLTARLFSGGVLAILLTGTFAMSIREVRSRLVSVIGRIIS